MKPTEEQFRKVIFEGATDPEVEKYLKAKPPKDLYDLGDPSTYKIEKYIKYYNDLQKYRPYDSLADEFNDTIYALHWFYRLEKHALEKQKATADDQFDLKTKMHKLCESIDIISESLSNLSDALELMSPWNETKEIDETIDKIKMDAKAGIVSSTSILSTARELLSKTQALYKSVHEDVFN